MYTFQDMSMNIFNKLRSYFKGKLGPAGETQLQLSNWFESFPGQAVLELESEHLAQLLPTMFGYHLLQIGYCHVLSKALKNSKISHRMVMNHDPGSRLLCDFSELVSDAEALPYRSDSLDVVVLSHALEFSSHPHQILREVDRCLIPEGHAVFVAFNPYGFSGLWRWLFAWKGRPPWNGRFISRTRLRDWVELLGFDVVDTHSLFFRPPLHHLGLMRRLEFMERFGRRWWSIFGGVYILVAQKRVATLTPLKARWRPRRSRVTAPGLAGRANSYSKPKKSSEFFNAEQ